MFIVWWGKKRQAKRMGYAADFCPICREFQPFAIDRMDINSHIYGLSLGKGQTVGFIEVCETCGFGSGVDLSRFKEVQTERADSLAALLEATYPDAYADYAQRLFLEGDVWRSPHQLDADLRRALVKQPFLLLANQAAYQGPIQATGLMIAGIVLAVGALILLPLIVKSLSLPPSLADPLTGLLFFGGLGGVLWGIVKDALARRHREPLPLLLKALRPLQPTGEELADAMGDLTVRSLSVWQGQTPERLLKRLRAMEAAEAREQSTKTWLAES